jgi:hypothetical protein
MKSKIRDANEVDVIVDCRCGTSFYVYLPDAPYECPGCHSLYEVKLHLEDATGDDQSWRMLGQKVNE